MNRDGLVVSPGVYPSCVVRNSFDWKTARLMDCAMRLLYPGRPSPRRRFRLPPRLPNGCARALARVCVRLRTLCVCVRAARADAYAQLMRMCSFCVLRAQLVQSVSRGCRCVARLFGSADRRLFEPERRSTKIGRRTKNLSLFERGCRTPLWIDAQTDDTHEP